MYEHCQVNGREHAGALPSSEFGCFPSPRSLGHCLGAGHVCRSRRLKTGASLRSSLELGLKQVQLTGSDWKVDLASCSRHEEVSPPSTQITKLGIGTLGNLNTCVVLKA